MERRSQILSLLALFIPHHCLAATVGGAWLMQSAAYHIRNYIIRLGVLHHVVALLDLRNPVLTIGSTKLHSHVR